MRNSRHRSRLLRHSTAGIQFTLTFLLGLGGGYLLDRHMKTTPGFTAWGGLLGFLIGVYRLFRQGRGILREGDKHRQQARGREPSEDDGSTTESTESTENTQS